MPIVYYIVHLLCLSCCELSCSANLWLRVLASAQCEIPCLAVLGQRLPQATGPQHPHVPPELQGRGQFSHPV